MLKDLQRLQTSRPLFFARKFEEFVSQAPVNKLGKFLIKSYVQTQIYFFFEFFLDFWLHRALEELETSRFMYIWPPKNFQNSRGNRVWKFEKKNFWKMKYLYNMTHNPWLIAYESLRLLRNDYVIIFILRYYYVIIT